MIPTEATCLITWLEKAKNTALRGASLFHAPKAQKCLFEGGKHMMKLALNAIQAHFTNNLSWEKKIISLQIGGCWSEWEC